MKILAIETSCDETACAVMEDARVLSNVVVSQVDIFAEYGGVIPEVAARSHLEAILPVVKKAMAEAGVGKGEIDAIAVTHTPGLLGSLLVGTLTARVLAILWGKPLYAVHHLKSHIYACWADSLSWRSAALPTPVRAHRMLNTACLRASSAPCAASTLASSLDDRNMRKAEFPLVASAPERNSTRSLTMPEFPLVALVVSGGHTQIIYMRGHNEFEIVGTTRDDAVGECFDKVAKILGLPYPGGPSIAECAKRQMPQSDTPQEARELPQLPRPRVEGLDFSFSGLKTAVLRAVQAELGVPISTPSYELAGKLTEEQRANFAASFQETASEILVEKVKMALEKYPEVKTVVVCGGVSANEVLRKKMNELSGRVKVCFPEVEFAGDNAAMVGVAAYFEIISGVEATDPYELNIMPRSGIS